MSVRGRPVLCIASHHMPCQLPWLHHQSMFLMQALQAVLRKLKVEHLVLPSVPSLRRMWTQRFGFSALTIAEAAAVEPHIIMLDSTSAGLLKKPLHAPTMCA